MQTISLLHIFYKGEDGVWRHYATYSHNKHNHVKAMEEADRLHDAEYEVVSQPSKFDLPD